VSTSTLEKRVEVLEAASGRDGDCERCRGLLTIVRNVITGAFHSASWNGEALAEDELGERVGNLEAKCPRCGRDLSGEQETVIRVGGRK
jgi:hypothetical protein